MTATDRITISSRGDENTYYTFFLGVDGDTYVLTSELTQYFEHTGSYLVNAAKTEIAIDQDNAIDAATDMEWKASSILETMDVDHWAEPGGFPEILEKHFEMMNSARLIAAE